MKNINKKNIIKGILYFLLTLLLGFIIMLLFFTDFDTLRNHFMISMSYSLAYGLPLAIGNGYIAKVLNKKLPWQKNSLKRLIVGVLLSLIYSSIVIISADFMLSVIFQGATFATYTISVKFVVLLLVITFLITFTFYGIGFFEELKKAIVREEELKRNILELEYATLKNQVNPHFLFNSLNVLTSLVSENKDAVKYIKTLAEVYRYLLEHKDKQIVDLQTELKFVEAYLYLHQIRFGTNLKVNITVSEYNYSIVPLSLQMLTENAIKHNIISEEQPLQIDISISDGYIIVKNNLQIKKTNEDSLQIGLENIKKRYSYLTDKEVIVEKNSKSFIVKLPLSEIKK
ncbi:MAG: hypothetical protein GXO80_11585 [Chlorobi bacterium]|nr:hypothetical protein [Chlorobiota bacterium]